MTVLAHSRGLLIFLGCCAAVFLGLKLRPKGAMPSDKVDAIGGAAMFGFAVCIVILAIRFVRFWMR